MVVWRNKTDEIAVIFLTRIRIAAGSLAVLLGFFGRIGLGMRLEKLSHAHSSVASHRPCGRRYVVQSSSSRFGMRSKSITLQVTSVMC